MIRDDYILRQIRQLAEVIARVAGLAQQAKTELAQRELDAVWTDVLGVPRGLVDHLDRRSLFDLLRDPDKLRAAGQLLLAEVELAGNEPRAATLRERALDLYREAHARDPQPEDDAILGG